MARTAMTDEEKKESRKKWNKKYYEKSVATSAEGEPQRFSDYLAEKGKKQVKLTLDVTDYDALKEYCDANGLKIQDYIKQLIKDALGI